MESRPLRPVLAAVRHMQRLHSRVCAVFELNDEAKIVSWREYWDTGNIIKQMGVTREELDKDIA